MLEEHDRSEKITSFKKLEFKGVGGKDVYNITSPFESGGEKIIAGRVESRESERDSKIMFFEFPSLELIRGAGFDMQDPFVNFIGDEIVLGGVEIFLKGKELLYRSVFYRGKDIFNLKKFAKSPIGMKDIRLIELNDKRIGIFTRPEGKIGFGIISNLDELNEETIKNADIIDNMFGNNEWGGVNEVYLLDKDKMGVLAHIACFDDKNGKHYYPIAFIFDFEKRKAGKIKIIAVRKELGKGESKHGFVKDVIFPGGLIIENDRAKLYVGAGDAEAYEIVIKNPF